MELAKIVAGIIGVVTGLVGLMVLLSFVTAIPVWLLWNWLCPMLFGLPSVGLIQAWGLTLLCAFLFKSSSSTSNS